MEKANNGWVLAQRGGEKLAVWQVQTEYSGVLKRERATEGAGSLRLLGVERVWTHPKCNEKKPLEFSHRE